MKSKNNIKIFFFICLFVVFSLGTLIMINYMLSGKVNNNVRTTIKTSQSLKTELENRNKLASDPAQQKFTLVNKKITIPSSSINIGVWQNEKEIIGKSREELFLAGPDLFEPVPKQYQNNPIKLLFIGDSYSNGQFGTLNELTYPRILEKQLNLESPGAYKISVLANSKSSFLRQSDWLTPERLARYQPDAVILTYTAGRLIPHFYEKKYCKQYNTCIKDSESDLYYDGLANDYENSSTKYRIIMCLESENNAIGAIFKKILYPYLTNIAEYLAVRYCTYDKIKRGFDMPTDRDPSYYKDPLESPYFDDFLEYLSKSNSAIEEYNKDRANDGKDPVKKYMINLTWVKDHFYPPVAGRKSYSGALIKAYHAFGYSEIPNTNARFHILSQDYTKLGNVQGGKQSDGICFYQCIIDVNQMSENINNYEKGVLNNPLVYRFGTVLHTAFAKDLESYLAGTFQTMSQPPVTFENILDEYGPWFISYKKLNNESFVYGNYQSDPSKNTFCGRINHPYTIFSVNNFFFKEGDNLKIGYSEGEIEDMIVVVERSKSNGERFLSEAYLLKNNEAVSIKYEKEITSIYLGDYNVVCNEEGTALPKFTAMLSKY